MEDDDIDIEEHDLLENPAIKSAFPDLSIVKKELEKYEKDEICEGKECDIRKDEIVDWCLENDIDLNVLITSDKLSHYSNAGNFADISNFKDTFLYNVNAFVKDGPNVSHDIKTLTVEMYDFEDHEIKMSVCKSKVLLNDLKTYLDNTDRYCVECSTLFSDKSSYGEHISRYHYYQQTNDDLTPYVITQQSQNCNSNLRYKCKLCLDIFPSSEINQHLLSHKDCQIMLNKIKDNNSCKINTNFNIRRRYFSSSLVYKCHICSHCFSNSIGFKGHMSRKHHLNGMSYSMKAIKFNGQCTYCPSNFSEIFKYNNHLTKKHTHQKPKSGDMYKCHICTTYNKSMIKSILHLIESHGYKRDSVYKKRIIIKCKFKEQCAFCPRKFDCVKTYNMHIKNKHSDMFSKPVDSQSMQNTTGSSQMMFRCFICSYYFVSSRYYNYHLHVKHGLPQGTSTVKEYPFSSKCIFCKTQFTSITNYNKHIIGEHREIRHKKVSAENINREFKIFEKILTSTDRDDEIRPQENNKPSDNSQNKAKLQKYNYVHEDRLTALNDRIENCQENTEVLKSSQFLEIEKSSSELVMEESKDYFKCYVCSYLFLSLNSLLVHLSINHNEQSDNKAFNKAKFDFCCNFCTKKFHAMRLYNRHIAINHYNNYTKKNVYLSSRPPTSDANVESQAKQNTIIDDKHKYYRCYICTHYSTNAEALSDHLFQKHNASDDGSAIVDFDPICYFCAENQTDIDMYNSHLLICSKNYKINQSIDNEDDAADIERNKEMGKKVSVTKKSEAKRIQKVIKINTIVVPEEYRCHSCAYKSSNPASYYIHLSSVHFIENYKFSLPKFIDLRNHGADVSNNVLKQRNITKLPFLLSSALFKCSYCDICFLSAQTAMNHVKHKEYIVNVSCSICDRIFKIEDSPLHEKQHDSLKDIKIYDIQSTYPTSVLFGCPKCAIYFHEDDLIEHQLICEQRKSESSYCKFCDVLINNSIYQSHYNDHVKRDLKLTDIMFIESALMLQLPINAKLDKILFADVNDKKSSGCSDEKIFNTNSNRSYHHCLFYCDTCKCFSSYKYRLYHHKKLCLHIRNVICESCGLILDHKSYTDHQNAHTIKKLMKLQCFKFYNLVSGKKIRPPIPEYPKCKSCDLSFMNEKHIVDHVCDEMICTTCSACEIKIKFTDLNIHSSFHCYSKQFKNDAVSNQFSSAESSVAEEIASNILVDSHHDFENYKIPSYILYQCQSCKLVLNRYDKVVEHCQSHFIMDRTIRDVVLCELCSLVFDKSYITEHRKNHELCHGRIFFTLLTFDLLYFTAESKIWKEHLFQDMSQDKVDKELMDAIYKFEHRILMSIHKNGKPDFTVYMCNTCHCCMDPSYLFKHAENSCFKVRQHLCNFCRLPFISSMARDEHEKKHVTSNYNQETCRVISFNNNPAEKSLNKLLLVRCNQYTLFQCRICNEAMDESKTTIHKCNNKKLKGCVECGLLIREEQYDIHILRHKELPKFTEKKIKIILFGDEEEIAKTNAPPKIPLYDGSIFDYTCYKCNHCETCTTQSNTLNHVCTYSKKIVCSKCNLYFSMLEYKIHIKVHETDVDFIRRNIRVIPFRPMNAASSVTSACDDQPMKTSDEYDIFENNDLDHSPDDSQTHEFISATSVVAVDRLDSTPGTSNNTTTGGIKIINVYKCFCGVHFFNKDSLVKHTSLCIPEKQTTKQKCPKCYLLFTPEILVSHMVLHQGDLNLNYKYNIIS